MNQYDNTLIRSHGPSKGWGSKREGSSVVIIQCSHGGGAPVNNWSTYINKCCCQPGKPYRWFSTLGSQRESKKPDRKAVIRTPGNADGIWSDRKEPKQSYIV